jgi:hypothetical protein
LTEEEQKEEEVLATSGDGEAANDEQGGNSKATKDDKAPIKTETWDKFLYLGLDEKIKKRGWAVAARTTRPLVARHWRRIQLRKRIWFVKEK